MNKFKGVFPALITPYEKSGALNETSLRKLINMNLNKGVSGFYINGSSSETYLLSLEEKKQVVDNVVDEVAGRGTVICHVGDIGTSAAIELAKYAASKNVDAISAVPPFYYKFGYEEIKRYYLDIMDSTDLPMIVYNIPSLSGVQLTMTQFKDLLSDERVIGVKHTSMNLYELERLNYHAGKIVYNGHDECYLGGLVMGSCGGIGSTFNLMAEKFVLMGKLFESSKLDEAFDVQRDVNNVVDALISVGVFQGIKYGLEKNGIECNGCRAPFSGLTSENKALLDEVFTKSNII